MTILSVETKDPQTEEKCRLCTCRLDASEDDDMTHEICSSCKSRPEARRLGIHLPPSPLRVVNNAPHPKSAREFTAAEKGLIRKVHGYPRGRSGETSADRRYAENGGTNFEMKPGPRGGDPSGRWPANVIHDGSDEVLEMFAGYGSDKGASAPVTKRNSHKTQSVFSGFAGQQECGETFYADQGTAARFFQCCPWTDDELIARFFYSGKVSSAERNDSTHPTIKPLSLMRYLVRLITPPQGVVLDLFAGTGPTGEAALQEGADYILIEKEAESIKDINRRMHGAQMGFPLNAGKSFA